MNEVMPVYPVDSLIGNLRSEPGEIEKQLLEPLGGVVFNSCNYDDPEPSFLDPILVGAGWVINNEGRFAPNPERLKNALRSSPVDVEFCMRTNQEGDIPFDSFVYVLDQGKHPVGVVNLRSYVHDISIDHLPAPLVVGSEIFELLRPIGNPSPSNIVETYDATTTVISGAISEFLMRRAQGITKCSILGDMELLVDASERETRIRKKKLELLTHQGLERLGII